MKTRKAMMFLAAAAMAATFSFTVSAADAWPNGPITLLCGYSAGGSSDLCCRYMAAGLEKQLGVPVVVENVPGSGSWLAWNRLLKNSEADGNTFALVNLSAVYGHYDEANPREDTIDDFELLTNQVIDSQVVAIRLDDDRFSDYESLIEYGKENPLIVAAATTGITSGDGTIMKYLEKEYGVESVIIPVDGSSDAETMFLAGEVDILLANVGDVMGAEDNGYKPVIVYAEERSQYLPDVPTEIELGMGSGYVSFSARGYAYMKGVDEAIVEKMIEAQSAVFEDEEYVKNMEAIGCELELYTGDDYYNLLDSQLESRLDLWDVQR